jgi:hypothetical protein
MASELSNFQIRLLGTQKITENIVQLFIFFPQKAFILREAVLIGVWKKPGA